MKRPRFVNFSKLLQQGFIARQERETTRFTLEQLANEIEFPIKNSSIVRAWVRGNRLPTFEQKEKYLPKLSDKLNLPLKDLYEAYQLDRIKTKISDKTTDGCVAISMLEKMVGEQSSNSFPLFIEDRDISSINGQDQVEKVLINIVSELDVVSPNSRRIMMTFHGYKSIIELSSEKAWHSALQSALDKGWNIQHLIRLNSDSSRTFSIVSKLMSFLGRSGEYEPFIYKEKSLLKPTFGFLIIEGKHAFINLSSKNPLLADSTILLKEKTQINTITRHYELLKNESTFSAYKKFWYYNEDEITEALYEADKIPGNRIIISKRLAEITRPLNWYNINSSWAQSLKLHQEIETDKELENHLKNRLRRAVDLRKNIKDGLYNFRYIYPQYCLDYFLNDSLKKSGEFIYYYTPNNQEKKQYLEETLLLLRENDNFEILLLNNLYDQIFPRFKPTYCEVHGENLILMEIWNEEKKRLWYLIRDRNIVSSFQDYFSKIWNDLYEKNGTKKETIKWLKMQIDKL